MSATSLPQQAQPPATFDTLIQPLELTAGGRPVLLSTEMELLTKTAATVLAPKGDNNFEPRLQDGSVTITTHRVLWQGTFANTPMHVCIALWHLREVKPNPDGRWKASNKVQLWALGQTPADTAPAAMVDLLRGGRDELLSTLTSAFRREAWITITATDVMAKLTAATVSEFNHAAGIAGILRRQEAARATATQMASEAFADLDSLIGKAKEVVAVISRYQAAQAGATAEEKQADSGDLSAALLNIGFISPVTKETAGTQYHQQLARQLADFLGAGNRGLLQRVGGMMTLPDIYAIFNRARGTQLISPEDLLTVSRMLSALGLGMRLRTFPSGVAVIQSDAYDDAAVGEQLVALAKENALMATSVAAVLHVSLVLAQEHLATAEQAGLLCRDETLEGLRFYPNLFPQYCT